MKFKISFINQIKALSFFIQVLAGMLLYLGYLSHENKLDRNLIFIIVMLLFVSFLPVLYLHLEYLYNNMGDQFEIDSYERKLSYTNNKEGERVFSFDELSKIVMHIPPSMYRGSNFRILPFEQYHTQRFTLNQERK